MLRPALGEDGGAAASFMAGSTTKWRPDVPRHWSGTGASRGPHGCRKLAARVRTPALLARHSLTHATFAISWPRSSASAAVLK